MTYSLKIKLRRRMNTVQRVLLADFDILGNFVVRDFLVRMYVCLCG